MAISEVLHVKNKDGKSTYIEERRVDWILQRKIDKREG